MSMLVLLKGFGLGASMIIPIGAQNAFVLNQGIKRNHHLMTAAICSVCDIVLITLGVFGLGMFFASDPQRLMWITIAGSSFLIYYAALSLRSAWNAHNSESSVVDSPIQSRWKVLVSVLAVTLLNPHVYLDTIVVLGALGSQYQADLRVYFALGTALASLVWFFGLSIAAARMSTILSRKKVKIAIDLLVALIMLVIATQLIMRLF